MATGWSDKLLLESEGIQPGEPALWKKAGIEGVVVTGDPGPGERRELEASGIPLLPPSVFTAVRAADAIRAFPGGQAIRLKEGIWPGIRRPPNVAGRGDETASASREPWVDSNGHWTAYARALYPEHPVFLSFPTPPAPDRVLPFDALELALAEAWAGGGNYLMTVPPPLRKALAAGDGKAKEAWQRLSATAGWLQQNANLFRRPALPVITAVVEPGTATAEIANLLYRRNAAPELVAAGAIPDPDPSRRALIAAQISLPDKDFGSRILAHAYAGTTIIAAGREPWWLTANMRRLRTEADREFFAVGKGRLVVYRKPVADPSEFALDVIDIVTHRQRPARLWNAPAVILMAREGPRAGERVLLLVNYGSAVEVEFPARIFGHYSRAMLLRPESPTLALTAARRGESTEVNIPAMRKIAAVVFS